MERLIEELLPLLAGLRDVLATGAGEQVPVRLDRTRADEVLAHLKQLLQDGSMVASELARTEEALLRLALGTDGDEVLRRTACYDYQGRSPCCRKSAQPRSDSVINRYKG